MNNLRVSKSRYLTKDCNKSLKLISLKYSTYRKRKQKHDSPEQELGKYYKFKTFWRQPKD